MRDWDAITKEERRLAYGTRSIYNNRLIMKIRLSAVCELLERNPAAKRMAHELPRGAYLINTADEIADYCVEKAQHKNVQEVRYAQ